MDDPILSLSVAINIFALAVFLAIEQRLEKNHRGRKQTQEMKKIREDQWQMMVEISHNLQSPLTIIKVNLGSLKEQFPTNDHFARFERSIDRMSRFIYDLMKLARLEIEEIERAAEPLDLAAAIEELLESLELLAADQGIIFRRDLAPDLVARIPQSKLEMLIMNLVGNAFTYRSPGRLHEVELRLFRSERYAQISVRDTGIGIRPDEQGEIFNRFYRAGDNSATKGTGLGLPICKKIAETYGGTISIASEFGKGSIFTVCLPLDS